MSRYGWIGITGVLFVATAAWGCGDDDDEPVDAGNGGAPTGETLENLSAADKEELCSDLLAIVRDASTPERQCIELAVTEATSESSCNRLRMECIDEEAYDDFDAVRCAEFTGSGAQTPPDFDCDTRVSEVLSCYRSVSNWLKGLRCNQAADAPEIPACVGALEDDCDFGLSQLIEERPEVDAGSSCEPSGTSCMCSGETLRYDFGLGTECNTCAVQNCCDSFAECQNDTACKCYWDCLGEGKDDCYAPCNIATFPPAFTDHASCLSDNCAEPCDLRAP